MLKMEWMSRMRWRIARRGRRGSQLIEAALVLVVVIPAIELGARIGAGYAREAAGLNEARLLTQVADAGAALALRDLDGMINAQIGAGNARVLSLSDLEAEGLWSFGSDQLTALGREVSLLLHARGSQELVVLARASALEGERAPHYVPQGGQGVGLVGYVPPSETTRLRGPGLNYDLATLQNLTGGPEAWDTVAIRVLRMDRHVLPFLHRVAQPGYPELNRMETDLDLNGFDLLRVGTLEAERVSASVDMQAGKITGDLTVTGDVTVSGNMAVEGIVVTNQAQVNGEVAANALSIIGQATIGALDADSVTTTGSVSINNDLVVEGSISVEALAATDLSANALNTDILSVGTLTSVSIIGTSVSATTGQIQSLIVENCEGC